MSMEQAKLTVVSEVVFAVDLQIPQWSAAGRVMTADIHAFTRGEERNKLAEGMTYQAYETLLAQAGLLEDHQRAQALRCTARCCHQKAVIATLYSDGSMRFRFKDDGGGEQI